VTILDGIRGAVSPSTRVLYAQGSDIWLNKPTEWGELPDDGFGEAMAAAERADAVIMVLGIDSRIEGEEGSAPLSPWKGDRIRIDLPEIQKGLFRAVAKKGKPIVLVLHSGSPVAVAEEDKASAAVLMVWYPGEEGGAAVADVLFGSHNPSGRLPVTVVKSTDQLPPYTDYGMSGRTYRFMNEEPLYPFGFGLSYTDFSYSGLELAGSVRVGEPVSLSFTVKNEGKMDGHEIVQLYITDLEASVRVPLRQLAGFSRVHLAAGESKSMSFTVSPRQMSLIDEAGKRVLEPGRFRVFIGGRQPDSRSAALAKTPILEAEFEVKGNPKELVY
jgi:beta-glucosidase